MIPTEQRDRVQHYRPLAQLVPAHWHTGSLEAADGTRIHYTRTGGDKPTVLCLHGVQGSGLTWLRTAQALEATYEVILPDARGHGLSGRVGPGLSEDVLVDDLLRLLRTLELDQPFVVGHSMRADLVGRLAVVHQALLGCQALRLEGRVGLDDLPTRTLVERQDVGVKLRFGLVLFILS